MNEIIQPSSGMGAPVRRKEDKALVTGAGHYTDDYHPAGTLRAYVVRSSMAHARIRLGDVSDAREMAGVRLILTADDLDGLGGLPCRSAPKMADGSRAVIPPHPLLVGDIVRHVGDPIAFIVADSLSEARNAGEAIEIDYEPLDVVVGTGEALKEGASLVWPDHPGNLAFVASNGERPATEAAFAKAVRVSRVEIVNNRVVANYMETRGVVAEYDAASDRYTLTLGTQGGHGVRNLLAKYILKVDPDQIRVITPDVGGAFGTKQFLYQEYPLAALAAKKLGRPVKWIGERSEHFLLDAHGRDNIAIAEMAMDNDNKFLALRVNIIANLGAYLSQFGPDIPTGGMRMLTGLYDIEAMYSELRGVYTNTVPVDAYRGAGRPEAAYLIERLVDVCGRDTGLGPIGIRQRNFIQPEQMPYQTPGGRNYDSGEFAGHLERALEVSDADGFAARREKAQEAGRVRGFGISTYIEACAFPGSEPATLTLNTDGSVTLLIGTQDNGQGHATAYAQFITGHLGIDYDRITVIQGDTDRVKQGGGTGGSRSIPIGVVSVERAATTLAEQIKALASDQLEASASDLEIVDGAVRVTGTDRAVSLADLAASASDKTRLTAIGNFEQKVPTYPNGTHIAEVEIDPETGTTEIVGYWVVDDFGATVNPDLLAGQIYGGAIQGVGQALYEHTVYDDDGQLLSASLLDYCLPHADGVPSIHFETRNVPCLNNAFGIKGAGEAGSVGSCAAVMNAIVDALSDAYGIETIDMPATPARVWSAIQSAQEKAGKAA
jgi:aerobic carbon-monoxide dehydrogenase large subunit